MTAGSGLPVQTALRLPPLDRGRVVAGGAGVRDRHVRWVAVMEGPVEDFVAPGEFVLTIGAGYDEAGFERFATEIADARAAALCVSVGAGAYIGSGSVITEDVPAEALALGRGRQVVKEGWARTRRPAKG